LRDRSGLIIRRIVLELCSTCSSWSERRRATPALCRATPRIEL